MRTKTGILWTILVIACLLVLAESDPVDLVPSTLATTVPTPTIAKSVTTKPTLEGSTAAKSSSVDPTTAKAITTESPTAKTVHTEPPTTQPASTVPPTTKPTATEPSTTKSTATEAPTAKPTATESPPVKMATDPNTAKPTATGPSTMKPSATEPTPSKPIPTEPTPAKATHAGSIPTQSTPANPTSAGPALTPPATQGSSSVVPTHRHDQTPTSSLETPASTTVAAKPPASTQPGPDQTSQGPSISSQQPDLGVSQTTKPIVREPFNETITLEFMQEPRNKENSSVQSCLMLLEKFGVKGNCILTGEKVDGRYTFTSASVAVVPSVIQDIYDSISTTPPDSTAVPHTLIAILSSCGALLLILVIFALYCTYHHRSYRKNQQHLTEELQTVENGYHDNPTLEVMEVQPEMQEKKVALNGEFNDSWIVPFDNLAKEEIPDEEDTHL